MSFSQIIDSLGGYKEVARAIDVHPTTAFKWKRDGIPPSRFPDIVTLAAQKKVSGITLAGLHALHSGLR